MSVPDVRSPHAIYWSVGGKIINIIVTLVLGGIEMISLEFEIIQRKGDSNERKKETNTSYHDEPVTSTSRIQVHSLCRMTMTHNHTSACTL